MYEHELIKLSHSFPPSPPTYLRERERKTERERERKRMIYRTVEAG
jgi:hypothetical protein